MAWYLRTKSRRGDGDGAVAFVIIAIVVVVFAGAASQRKNKVPQATKKLPGPTGDLVQVSGDQTVVVALEDKVKELAAWARDAREWYAKYRDSVNTGDQLVAKKCVRDIETSCGKILAICDGARESGLAQVSGGASLLTSYEKFARESLKAVRKTSQ